MKPTETGPSSLERLTILCSTSSSKTRNESGARFSTGLSVGSVTVIGTRIILTSSRMLGLAAERFSRGVIVTLAWACSCGTHSAATPVRKNIRSTATAEEIRRTRGIQVVRAQRIPPPFSLSDTAWNTYIGRDRLNASIGQFPGGALERMGEIRLK
jgi:hypothetical protein